MNLNPTAVAFLDGRGIAASKVIVAVPEIRHSTLATCRFAEILRYLSISQGIGVVLTLATRVGHFHSNSRHWILNLDYLPKFGRLQAIFWFPVQRQGCCSQQRNHSSTRGARNDAECLLFPGCSGLRSVRWNLGPGPIPLKLASVAGRRRKQSDYSSSREPRSSLDTLPFSQLSCRQNTGWRPC